MQIGIKMKIEKKAKFSRWFPRHILHRMKEYLITNLNTYKVNNSCLLSKISVL